MESPRRGIPPHSLNRYSFKEESVVVNKSFMFAVCALLSLGGHRALADDVTFEQLLSRLQKTEQRLQELEQETTSPFRSVSQSFSVDSPIDVPPAETSDEDKEDDPTFEDRLEKLEKGWEELDDAWGAFDKAEKKKKADAAKKPTFKINGRIHADFWDFVKDDGGIGFLENPISGDPNDGADPEDRFAFRRIRLEMKGDVKESMLWRLQVEFANPSACLLYTSPSPRDRG